MKKRIERTFQNDKREALVYVVLFLWILLGVIGIIYQAELEHLGVYFIALTALVGSYIWAESARKSEKTSVVFKGKNSRRETMLYISILLWAVLGVWGVVTYADLLSVSAYFAALSPFVSAYILGETYKPVAARDLRPDVDEYGYGYGSGGYRGGGYRSGGRRQEGLSENEEYAPNINDYPDENTDTEGDVKGVDIPEGEGDEDSNGDSDAPSINDIRVQGPDY